MGNIYRLGKNGMELIPPYPIQENRAYYWGPTSDPGIVYITRITDTKVYFIWIRSPYWSVDGYSERCEMRNTFEGSIEQGMKRGTERDNSYYGQDYTEEQISDELTKEYPIPPDYETFEQYQLRLQKEREEEAKKPKPRYIDAAEVAKMIRQDLKVAFPYTKFSVKTERYAGGSSIDVDWLDGPTQKEVDQLIGFMHGASFDGMQDLETSHDSTYKGEFVHFGNSYLFTHRHYTEAFLLPVIQKVCQEWGHDPKGITFEESSTGVYMMSSHERINGSNWTLREVCEHEAAETSAYAVLEKENNEPEENAESAYSDGVTVGEYKGHPTISLPMEGKEFSFGVSKAKTIVAFYEQIKKFVEDNS